MGVEAEFARELNLDRAPPAGYGEAEDDASDGPAVSFATLADGLGAADVELEDDDRSGGGSLVCDARALLEDGRGEDVPRTTFELEIVD